MWTFYVNDKHDAYFYGYKLKGFLIYLLEIIYVIMN